MKGEVSFPSVIKYSGRMSSSQRAFQLIKTSLKMYSTFNMFDEPNVRRCEDRQRGKGYGFHHSHRHDCSLSPAVREQTDSASVLSVSVAVIELYRITVGYH